MAAGPRLSGMRSRDPSCPVETGCVLEALGYFGFRAGQPTVAAAVEFLFGEQAETGSWLARGSGNVISGTWQVLAGLHAIGFDMTAIVVRRAVRRLKELQNADGGWGESEKSNSASTAWALLGLCATDEADGAEARAGAEFLVGTQRADGGWSDSNHFPLMALARYASAVLPVRNAAAACRVDPGQPARSTQRAWRSHSRGGPNATVIGLARFGVV